MSYKANNLVALTWGREYDGFGRVVRETAPESSASTSTAEQTTIYTYDPSSRLATASSKGSSCFSESYGYNSGGDRTSSSVGVCGAETTKTRTFNSESQLTSPGYVYDALGRNTFIPASDAPANNAAITLSYNLVDQVTGITQTGSTTSFTYDALGRRVNETAGILTTVRHYGDSSDNPEWTTQLSGSNLTTDVYTGSLGSGLAVTTTFKGTGATASMQLTNLRGHVVTTLDLDSNSVSGWSVFDSFGNPQTSQTNTQLVNYSSYGQQERATNTTGLILMGARVYNPETNQFTSKDPVKGGNENPYTYPNDPINGSDFSGLWGWEETFMVLSVAAMFIPVAGQAVAVAQGLRVAATLLRLVATERKAIKLVKLVAKERAKLSNVKSSAKKLRHDSGISRSAKVSDRAGEIFTGSTNRVPMGNIDAFKLMSADGRRQYRSAYVKGKLNQSNFQSGNSRRGKLDFEYNIHVNVKN